MMMMIHHTYVVHGYVFVRIVGREGGLSRSLYICMYVCIVPKI
jgi:hypothetical protein